MEAQHFADIANTAVENLTAHVKNVTQIYNAGVVARIDVLSSEVALADAREKQIKAQNAVQLARANMSNLLRLPTVTTVVPDTNELPHRAITIQRAQAIDYALAHRWELQQAALNVKASEEKLNVAKAGNKPTVALTANMSWQRGRTDSIHRAGGRAGAGSVQDRAHPLSCRRRHQLGCPGCATRVGSGAHELHHRAVRLQYGSCPLGTGDGRTGRRTLR